MRPSVACFVAVLTSACCAATAFAQQSAARLTPYARIWEQLIAAEDARALTPAQLNGILQTLRSNEPEMRRLAVRALGRLERASLADTIAARLRDPIALVRAEAAHALAQALSRGAPGRARQQLSNALRAERDTVAAAALAESLGRLRYASVAEARPVVAQLLPLLQQPAPLGALRGLFFLVRQPPARAAFDAPTRVALLRLVTQAPVQDDPARVRIRTVAAAVTIAAGADAAAVAAILNDRDPFVRREAAAALLALTDTAASAPLVLRALADTSGLVRYEGLRAYARRLSAQRGCAPVLAAARDTHAHTALLALDALGTSCARTPRTVALLDSITRTLPADSATAWHPAAHALVSLAAREPDLARQRLAPFAAHPVFFVRTYAAQTATALRDSATLLRLSQDVQPNVRTAAVEGLRRVLGHAADSVYLQQLARDDSQLLMAAAAALDSTARADAAVALLDALDRVSQARRETSRDGRVALLRRARQLGNATLADRLQRYLTDFDPQIAEQAADALQAWTGMRPQPQPATPSLAARPTFEEAVQLARTRVVIQLDSGEVELELFPFAAPTNVARFVRLARSGYFDGLTFHRIAPNFVVQGGSPNANEYAGAGPFTRDELGLQNLRGTVGLSTRGRDTGDAQIYVNLIDNVRLDHDYTVFARVVRGLDVVDRLLEGAVMRKIVIR